MNLTKTIRAFCQRHVGGGVADGKAGQGLPPKTVVFADATAQKTSTKAQ